MTETAHLPRPSALVRIRGRIKAAALDGPFRDRWQRPGEVVEALRLAPGMCIADVGAGGGYFTYRLARAVAPGGRVYAIDTDPDMTALIAERSRRRGLSNVTVVEADADDPGVAEPIDLAFLVDALHHLPDPVDYLRVLSGRLAAGGRVAIVEAHPRWWRGWHATEPDELRAHLADAGYTVTDEHDVFATQSFVEARPTG